MVDHQLRPESADEAQGAAAAAAELGLRSRVLTVDWGGSPPPARHKMRAAREARYALLFGACRDEGASNLLLGHHAGDQAETLLLRLMHASGVDGLACMPAASAGHGPGRGVRLLRPLLHCHRAELEAHCAAQKLLPVDDPSNEDSQYQRNRLRQLLRESESTQVGAFGARRVQQVPQLVQDALLLQQLCSRVSFIQQRQATALLRRALAQLSAGVELPTPHTQRPRQGGDAARRRPPWAIDWRDRAHRTSDALGAVPHAILRTAPFGSVEEHTATAAVARLLRAVAGKEYPPSLSDTSKLAARLAGGTLVGAFTGGGCVAQPLVRSKGRYMLVVPQTHRHEALRLLRPPRDEDGGAEDAELAEEDEAMG